MLLEILDIHIQPQGLFQIELIADGVQTVKYFLGEVHVCLITYDGALDHMCVFINGSHQSKHSKIPFPCICLIRIIIKKNGGYVKRSWKNYCYFRKYQKFPFC